MKRRKPFYSYLPGGYIWIEGTCKLNDVSNFLKLLDMAAPFVVQKESFWIDDLPRRKSFESDKRMSRVFQNWAFVASYAILWRQLQNLYADVMVFLKFGFSCL